VTDADGQYAFDLTPRAAVYKLVETQPPGWLDGKDAMGTQGGTPGNDILSDIVLSPGIDGIDNTFGELRPAGLSGFVYVDSNNDGIKQADEAGIPEVKVILTGTDHLGQTAYFTTTTEANGAYSFRNLTPGTYTLTEVQPTGDDSCPCGAHKHRIRVWWEGAVRHCRIHDPCDSDPHHGSFSHSSLTDRLFADLRDHDWNEDLCESDDEGLLQALFHGRDLRDLFNRYDADESFFARHVADFWNGGSAMGREDSTAYFDAKDTIGTQGGVAGNDVLSNIVLDWGVNGTDNNFGELKPASLSGSVWVDDNNDGIKQSTEKGISRVRVTLTGIDDRGHAVEVTTITDCHGAYEFENLRPGSYTLTESAPVCYLDGKDAIGTQGGIVENDVLSFCCGNGVLRVAREG
jgi:hypothetical protein